MDPCKTLRNDRNTPEISRLQCRMLTRGTFAIVVVCNNDPRLSGIIVSPSCRRRISDFVCEPVCDLIGEAIFCVNRTDQGVVRDVIEMATIAEPGASGRDVICCALSLSFDETSHWFSLA